MDYRVQVGSWPATIVFYLLQLLTMAPVKDTIASDMIPLSFDVFFDPLQNLPIVNATRLKEHLEIVDTEVPVRASMTFSSAGWMLSQDFLTRIRCVPSPAASGISTHVTISVSDIIPILFVESLVSDQLESLSPKYEAILQRQPNSLKKQGVLQSSEVLQMTIFTEVIVQIPHAQWKVFGKSVDRSRSDVSS